MNHNNSYNNFHNNGYNNTGARSSYGTTQSRSRTSPLSRPRSKVHAAYAAGLASATQSRTTDRRPGVSRQFDEVNKLLYKKQMAERDAKFAPILQAIEKDMLIALNALADICWLGWESPKRVLAFKTNSKALTELKRRMSILKEAATDTSYEEGTHEDALKYQDMLACWEWIESFFPEVGNTKASASVCLVSLL